MEETKDKCINKIAKKNKKKIVKVQTRSMVIKQIKFPYRICIRIAMVFFFFDRRCRKHHKLTVSILATFGFSIPLAWKFFPSKWVVIYFIEFIPLGTTYDSIEGVGSSEAK